VKGLEWNEVNVGVSLVEESERTWVEWNECGCKLSGGYGRICVEWVERECKPSGMRWS
jgi:hypothetical protein